MLAIQILLIITTFVNLSLAIIVFLNTKNNLSSKFFSLFLFFVALWSLGKYYLLFSREYDLVNAGAITFDVAPMYTVFFLVLFTLHFPHKDKFQWKKSLPFIVITTSYSIFQLIKPDFITESITINQNGLNILDYKPLPEAIYSLYFIVYVFFACRYLWQTQKTLPAKGKALTRAMFYSIVLTASLAIFTNTILTQLGFNNLIWMGSNFTLIFAATTLWAIAKYRIFNIRSRLVVQIAYSITLTVLFPLIYVILGLAIFNLFDDLKNEIFRPINLITIFAVIAQFFIGMIIFFKNPKNINNILFALFTYSFLGWGIANWYSITPEVSSQSIGAVRWVMFFAVAMTSTYALFTLKYLESNFWKKYINPILYSLCALFVGMMSLTSLLFKNIETDSSGSIITEVNFGIVVFIAFILYTLYLVFNELINKIKSKQNDKTLKLLTSFSVLFLIITPLSQFVFTLLFNSDFFVRISPLYALMLSISLISLVVNKSFMYVTANQIRSTVYRILIFGFLGTIIYQLTILFSNKNTEVIRDVGTYVSSDPDKFVPVLLTTALIQFIFAIFVLSRNIKNSAQANFLSMIISIMIWTLGLAAFLQSQSLNSAELFAHIYYIAPIFIAYFVLMFAFKFPMDSGKIQTLNYLLPSILLAIMVTIPGFLIESVEYQTWGKNVVLNTSGYFIYTLYFSIYFVLAIFNLSKKFSHASSRETMQLRYTTWSIAVCFIAAMITNLYLPWVNNYKLIWMGPVFTLGIIFTINYAISKYRLMDINDAFKKSIVYILASISVSIGIGISIVLILVNLNGINDNQINLIIVIGSIIAGIIFWPTKFVFDSLTRQIFYRAGYDTRNILDKLSDLWVSETNTDRVAHQSLEIIAKAINIHFGKILIIDDNSKVIKTFEFGADPYIENSSIQDLVKGKKSLIITDDIEDQKLKNSLLENEIYVVKRLETHLGLVGVLVLGEKLNGSIYSRQDIELIELSAKNLAIAIRNTLNFETIKEFSQTLQGEVEIATKKLRETNEKLKQIDKNKDEFVSMASHQLRTPLTAIKSLNLLLLDDRYGKISEKQKQALRQTYGATERMVILIEELLNVSRLSSGTFELQEKKFNLTQLVKDSIDQMKQLAKQKNIKIELSGLNKKVELSADDTKIREVILNFIDNAIQYSKENTNIKISLATKKDCAEFTVKDTGIGVSKSEKDKLFDKFYRSNSAKNMRPDGTGLGLYIAQKVIDAHGGEIIFKSQKGKGSAFGFRLPL